jgi:transcriptional regulator NrdR family protein
MGLNRIGPPCPRCGHEVTAVVATRRCWSGSFLRRRRCVQCSWRFNTAQSPEYAVTPAAFRWTKRQAVIEWNAAELREKWRGLLRRSEQLLEALN